jgi:putative 2-oxoglutarate-Fe(II)-dependent oxygenase superfamily protein
MIKEIVKSQHLWATPTLTLEHENITDLNRGLARIILEKEREIILKGKPTRVAGIKEGLTAHWLEYNVLNWQYPEIEEFRKLVLYGAYEFMKMIGDPDDQGLKICGISCWANVLRFGEALDVHHHDPAFLSAHYTVQSGREGDQAIQKDTSGGETIYFRPGFMDRSHGGEAAGFVSPWDLGWRISAAPIEGRLFFFPSYIRHEVRPNLSRRERISIAMDIFIARQSSPIYFSPPRWFVP